MTSVNAELFHREHDPAVHYGPVWNRSRKSGDTFAACGEIAGSSATLTTHLPWVTCQRCKAELSERIA